MGDSVAPSPPPSLPLVKRNPNHGPPLSLPSLVPIYPSLPLSLNLLISSRLQSQSHLNDSPFPLYPIPIYLCIDLSSSPSQLLSILSILCILSHPYLYPSPSSPSLSSPHLSIVCHHVMSLCLCHAVIRLCHCVMPAITD